MAVITWLNKIDGLDLNDPQKNVNAADMNEIKSVVNTNEGLTTAAQSNIDTHEALTNNPHSVTKAQVGLSAADNTSDADKPVSTAQQAALDLKANINNPTFTTGIITPSIQITGGTPGAQKVLTSDTDGHGTWVATDAAPTNGSTNLVRSDGVFDSINGVISDMALKAPLASPTFTGIPAAPTAAAATDTTQLATTAFVHDAIGNDTVWGEVPSGAINDVNDTYTIATTAQKLAVYKNGLRQNPSSYTFTPSTNTFVMSVAPETGDTLLTDYQK